MQPKKIFLLFLLCVLLSNSGFSHEVLTTWKLAEQSEDISISYRFVKIGDTLKTRQMHISFYVEANPEQMVEMFKNPNKLSAWSPGIKKCELVQEDSSSWITYNLFDIPWPFEKRDLITEYQVVKSETTVTLFLTGKPNLLPHNPDITRINNEGYWIFKPLENGKVLVEFYTIYLSKPVIPRFIKDPIIQKNFVNSINKLRALLAEQA